ncbi:Rv3654c family TadE-like protein [Schaalia sp. ZJ1691]|uniref:Rv3654c family TadE-like protein n=1 Tax=Schaalia sp. ZJ1691 TaxID=2709404 RepID=UPI0013EDFCEA|nr:Rv3654c family TadE-like protein [Schaalia sp. ZJ1691]
MIREEVKVIGPDDQGSGTILTVGVVALAAVLAGVCLIVGMVHAHHCRLQAVADVTALAGADVSAVAQWEDVGDRPCLAAREVTEANGLRLSSCEVVADDTRVVVEDSVFVLGWPVSITGRARAGPSSPTSEENPEVSG